MRDYAVMIKALRWCDDVGKCSECPEDFDCAEKNGSVMREAADAIEELESYCKELESQAPRWVSVEERLPGKDDMVFVYYEWTGQSGMVYKEVSLSTLGEIQHFGFKPIAWMPLPAPPKEDANENHS